MRAEFDSDMRVGYRVDTDPAAQAAFDPDGDNRNF
jgi:hypothetical protein